MAVPPDSAAFTDTGVTNISSLAKGEWRTVLLWRYSRVAAVFTTEPGDDVAEVTPERLAAVCTAMGFRKGLLQSMDMTLAGWQAELAGSGDPVRARDAVGLSVEGRAVYARADATPAERIATTLIHVLDGRSMATSFRELTEPEPVAQALLLQRVLPNLVDVQDDRSMPLERLRAIAAKVQVVLPAAYDKESWAYQLARVDQRITTTTSAVLRRCSADAEWASAMADSSGFER